LAADGVAAADERAHTQSSERWVKEFVVPAFLPSFLRFFLLADTGPVKELTKEEEKNDIVGLDCY